jgi:hypothetical protein
MSPLVGLLGRLLPIDFTAFNKIFTTQSFESAITASSVMRVMGAQWMKFCRHAPIEVSARHSYGQDSF